MLKTLILFAHPAFQRSRAQRAMLAAARSVPGATVFDLYEAYPDLFIDVAEQQALLKAHDLVVLQHPFYWYSSPAMLKEWQDHVLQFGWAYGPGGEALKGKPLLNAISTGGGEEAYHPEGRNRFTIRQFLAPFDQTAHLCGMPYLPPYALHGTFRLDEAQLVAKAQDYGRLLSALAEGRLDVQALLGLASLNDALPLLEAQR